MSDCVLDELLLISHRERAARRIRFHPRTTILLGRNGTGKSSIAKSIYSVLGADSGKISERWRKADVRAALRFHIDGVAWTAVRHAGAFSLFRQDGSLAEAHTRLTSGVGPAIAKLFKVGLRLTARDGKDVTPPPAFAFLPFYIDQDLSWQKAWAGFADLGQFAKWVQPVAEYHTGFRPAQYYPLKAAADRARRRAQETGLRLAVLRDTQTSLREQMTESLFRMKPELFRDELVELLAECRRLDIDERRFRIQLRELQARRTVLVEQKRATRKALAEAQKDLEYATTLRGQAVECPTCGAHYENSVANRFGIAVDEARCRELLVELDAELQRLDEAVSQATRVFEAAGHARARLYELLSERRGALDLEDVIRAEGQAEVRRLFRANVEAVAGEVRAAEVDAEDAERELRRLADADRSARVLQFFRDQMRANLGKLRVNLPEQSFRHVSAKVGETGSSLPRALLAYYYAILQTSREFSSSVFCPIVIDSPNQQAQDDINHAYVLQFLFERRPPSSQLVVGLESTRDVPEVILKDADVLQLEGDRLLRTEEFEELAAIVDPLLIAGFTLTSPDYGDEVR